MRRAFLSRSPWLFLALASLAGCKSRYDVDVLCETQAKAICRFQFECCMAVERFLVPTSGMQNYDYHTEAECVDAYTKFYCRLAAPVIDSVELERSTWDTEKAEACYGPLFDAYDTCDADGVFFPEGGASCKEIVRGELAPGRSCFADHECKSGFCRMDPNDGEGQTISASGSCEALPGAGEPCESGRCTKGLTCDFNFNTCVTPKKNGQPCFDGSECESGSCNGINVCANESASGVRVEVCDGRE